MCVCGCAIDDLGRTLVQLRNEKIQGYKKIWRSVIDAVHRRVTTLLANVRGVGEQDTRGGQARDINMLTLNLTSMTWIHRMKTGMV